MYLENTTDSSILFFAGLVVGGPNQDPAENLHVIMKGKLLTTTDRQGAFKIVVPHEAERLAITFEDRSNVFADTTVILPFERGQTVFHKVTLNLEDPPVEFETSEELTVPLGHAHDGSSVAELEVPANSFLTSDGDSYVG